MTSILYLSLDERNNGYEVVISDNGCGIPDSMKKSLFEPRSQIGGVGLHQATQIVNKYGSTIEVSDRVPNEPTQGASFRVWLPHPDYHGLPISRSFSKFNMLPSH